MGERGEGERKRESVGVGGARDKDGAVGREVAVLITHPILEPHDLWWWSAYCNTVQYQWLS